MSDCTRCGHDVGTGRFCGHCGHPVDDWRTGTAERPAVARPAGPPSPPPPPPPPPPPAGPPPSAARFPLYADEVGPAGAAPLLDLGGPPVAVPADDRPPRRGGWLPWVVGAVALMLLTALGGAALLLSDDDEPDPVATEQTAASSGTPTASPEPSRSPRPSAPPTPRVKPVDVAPGAVPAVPATAPPSTDLDGDVTRYDAGQMLDRLPTTCWRMAGDASGRELTFDLAEPTEITRVGLVNGYAKTAEAPDGGVLDWYAGNRRVLTVEWVFDDGTTVRQELDSTRRLQTVRVEPVVTGSVVLRLVSVSSPGTGRAQRDYTAISEVSLVGRPA